MPEQRTGIGFVFAETTNEYRACRCARWRCHARLLMILFQPLTQAFGTCCLALATSPFVSGNGKAFPKIL